MQYNKSEFPYKCKFLNGALIDFKKSTCSFVHLTKICSEPLIALIYFCSEIPLRKSECDKLFLISDLSSIILYFLFVKSNNVESL